MAKFRTQDDIKKAVRLYKKGYAIQDIAKTIQRSINTTRNILITEGVHKANSPQSTAKRREMIEALLAGKTVTEVANEYGVDTDYLRKLVYRTDNTYSVIEDKLVTKVKETSEVAVSQPEMGKEKEGLTTILIDAMIRSEEGNRLLRQKGFMPIVKEIEAAVEAIVG